MAKKEYLPGSYGAYMVGLIKRQGFKQEKFAKELKMPIT